MHQHTMKQILLRQNLYMSRCTPKKIYFEFGVANNNNLVKYIKTVQEFCKENSGHSLSDFHVYGFDSFSGLPKSNHAADKHVSFVKGEYLCKREILEANIKKTGFPLENVHLIERYFEDTLTQELLQKLLKEEMFPSIVIMDCDYYTSTQVATDWLYPLMQSGSIFWFDDIWSFNGHPEMGQVKYINEFNKSDKGWFFDFDIWGDGIQLKMFCKQEWEWNELEWKK